MKKLFYTLLYTYNSGNDYKLYHFSTNCMVLSGYFTSDSLPENIHYEIFAKLGINVDFDNLDTVEIELYIPENIKHIEL